MKVHYLLIIVLLSFFTACDGEKDKDPDTDKQHQEQVIQMIDHDFGTGSDMDPVHLALLEELNICDMDLGDTSSVIAKCNSENFRLYPLSDKIDIRDAFLIQTKSAIVLKGYEYPLPVRHVMIFEREGGELVKVMGIRGEMIAMEKGESDHKDIYVAMYYKKDNTLFNCKLSWDGKMYAFSVESMDWGEGPKAVKASLKDSVSNDIYTELRESNLLF